MKRFHHEHQQMVSNLLTEMAHNLAFIQNISTWNSKANQETVYNLFKVGSTLSTGTTVSRLYWSTITQITLALLTEGFENCVGQPDRNITYQFHNFYT